MTSGTGDVDDIHKSDADSYFDVRKQQPVQKMRKQRKVCQKNQMISWCRSTGSQMCYHLQVVLKRGRHLSHWVWNFERYVGDLYWCNAASMQINPFAVNIVFKWDKNN